MSDIEIFEEQKDCWYKGEKYSVRDNGAVMRHALEGKKPRKLDNIWTFGKSAKNGYLFIAGVQVHRIVATAFHGEAPSNQHIVDHTDTNRQNNRPSNLHWVTRLDNTILNPITRKKIEYLTGMRIEDVLADISVLKNTGLSQDFSWMCSVSQEEADKSLKMWQKWSSEPSIIKRNHRMETERRVDRFLLKNSQIRQNPIKGVPAYALNPYERPLDQVEPEDMVNDIEVPSMESRTPGVLLYDWNPDGDFPLCPGPGHSLEDYLANIEKGSVIYRNDYNHEIIVVEAGLSVSGDALMVKGIDEKAFHHNIVMRIFLKDNLFAHKRYPFSESSGQDKYYTLGLGKAWTEGDCFDDYCMHVSPDWLTTNQ